MNPATPFELLDTLAHDPDQLVAQTARRSRAARGGLAVDMMYGPSAAAFLDWADAQSGPGGARRDGLGMLVEQAAEAFVWWRGVRPDTRPVIDRLTVPLD